jgi:HK97 family phage portal protein
MNILGLFSPTGTLPILHREVGGAVTHTTQSVTTTTETSATQKTQGGSFEERVVYARNPQVALTVSVVHRAIELRSKTMGVMPVQYRRKDGEKGNFSPWMQGLGKRMNYLLQEEPNPVMSATSLWEQVTINQLQLGNGFVYIERDVFGDPVALWLAVCGGYNEIAGTYNILFLGEHGVEERVNVPRQNVMHFPNTFRYANGFWGIPTLQYAASELSLIKTEKQTALETAAKGGRVKLLIGEEKPAQGAGTLAFGMFNKDTMNSYADEINERIYQKDVVALRGLQQVQNISMTSAEMQMIEQMGLSYDDIARYYAVPRPLLMLDTNSHYNDYQNATMEFHTRTILPDKTDREKEIARKLLGMKFYGVRDIHICEKPLLAMDPERQGKVDQLNLQTGAKTVNEIRAEHDMPAVASGDIVYVSTNLAELGSEKLSGNGQTTIPTTEPTAQEGGQS